MLNKSISIFTFLFFHIALAMENNFNPETVNFLISRISSESDSFELNRQFQALIAINSRLVSSILKKPEQTVTRNNIDEQISQENLLALSFKQDTMTKTTELVGRKPKRITEFIKRLKHPELYNSNSESDCNLLLIGEPGTGKSSIAQYIAIETGRDYYKVPSSALITSFQGSGASAIRSLFRYVKDQGRPAVIFIDEIDGIADTTCTDNNREAVRTVYELHDQLDQKDNLIVCILATNYLDKVPTPLKSRFQIIKIEMPTYNKRLRILRHYAANFNIQDENLLPRIAEETNGLSCRDLEKLSKEAFNIAQDNMLQSNNNLDSLTLQQPIQQDPTFDHTPGEKGKEKESTTHESSSSCAESAIVSEIHYLLAIYTTQITKLPNEQVRKTLFNYYSNDHSIHSLSQEILDLAAKETDGFSAQDIEEAVNNAYDLTTELKSEQPIDLDLLAGIYYKQKIKFADGSVRSKLFEYFLNQYPNNIEEDTFSALASHTVDEFTGEEIRNIVTNARDLANNRKSHNIEDIDVCVGLHQAVRKKEKPFKTVYSQNRISNHSVGVSIPLPYIQSLSLNQSISSTDKTEEAIPLSENEQLCGETTTGYLHNKSTRKDYKTKINPNLRVRSFLFLYFISQIGHTLTLEQVRELIYKIEGFSWYSVEQFVKDAKDQSSDNQWQLNGNSFLKVSNKYNIILSNIFNNNRPPIGPNVADNALIAKIYNNAPAIVQLTIQNQQSTNSTQTTTQYNVLPTNNNIGQQNNCLWCALI